MPVPYDFYDYPAYWKSRKYEDSAERVALKDFFRVIGEKESLIEIGAGYGRLTSTYLPYAKKIVLSEPSEKLLAIAREKFKNSPDLSFSKTSLPSLSFPDGSFEVALMVRVLHHLPDSSPVIKEIGRILKPDGFLVLEFANKIHLLARIKAVLRGNFSFVSDLKVIERRSQESIDQKRIDFLNHHPKEVLKNLKKEGFMIERILSVSNFRNPIIKKIIPLAILLKLESFWQKFLAKCFFGPSIFVLARKTHNT